MKKVEKIPSNLLVRKPFDDKYQLFTLVAAEALSCDLIYFWQLTVITVYPRNI